MSTTTHTETTLSEPTGNGIGGRDMLARRIQSAASTLRSRASWLPGRYKVARAAHTTADVMESAADYVREQDVRGMMADARQIARRHPGATLLTAAALGFLIVRSLSRRG